MVFSIAVGAFVGVFLSLSTQNGWFPDPLCRSNVRSLIRAKNQTQSNTGAFDEDGVFNLDKFDLLFAKYAKSDKSGSTISLIELASMTKEQEKLGNNMKAWALSFIELCTAYFFVGHRGYLSKDDVRAAYDGSLFYRITDENRLRIEDTKRRKGGSSSLLKGKYLSKPTAMLSPKALEHKLEVLFSSLQSKSSIVSEYGLNEWVSYAQEMTEKIKKHALKRPSHIVKGVSTPTKVTKQENDEEAHSDPANLFPDGLTGVAKKEGEPLITEEYLSGLLSRSGSAELDDRGIDSKSYASMSSSGILTVNASFMKHSPETSIDEEEPFMSTVLRQDDNTAAANSLTGVQNGNKKDTHHGKETTKEEESLASLSSSSSSAGETNDHKKEQKNDHRKEEIQATVQNLEAEKKIQAPIEKSVQEKEIDSVDKSETEKEVPEPTITPPPEEKQHVEKQVKKTTPSKKGKKKNKQANTELQQPQTPIY